MPCNLVAVVTVTVASGSLAALLAEQSQLVAATLLALVKDEGLEATDTVETERSIQFTVDGTTFRFERGSLTVKSARTRPAPASLVERLRAALNLLATNLLITTATAELGALGVIESVEISGGQTVILAEV